MATSSETRRSNKFMFLRLPLYLVTRTVTLGLNGHVLKYTKWVPAYISARKPYPSGSPKLQQIVV